ARRRRRDDRRRRDQPAPLPGLPVAPRLRVRAALRRPAQRLAAARGALRPRRRVRRARRPRPAADGVGRRLLPLPVARAGRPALVDEPRRPHEPWSLRLDGLAAELRGRVRPDAREPSARFGPCGPWRSSAASRSIALTAARGAWAAPRTGAGAGF